MMKTHTTSRILAAVILAALALGDPATAQRVSEPELLLREALHKQQVQGDLPGAIKIYQQIVSARNGNRPVTARALLELAGCYEKLGQQAETVYQQIVRDFGDQPAAAQARARLAALRPPGPAPTMVLRKLELGDDVQQVIAAYGQRALFVGPQRTVFLGDLSGKDRRIVLQDIRATVGTPSPDLSSIVVYRTQTQQFSIIKTDGSGERALDLRENGRPLTMRWPGPLSLAWSWDNRYVLMSYAEESGSRLVRIVAADGTVTDVLPGRRGARRAQFSADGQYIAYHVQEEVYVVPSSGGESHLIATNAALVDWTRDGRHVLVFEPSAKGFLLSAVPVHQGRKQGERIALRSIPGPSVRTMINGSLFVSAGDPPITVRDTWVGILDDGDASITWTTQKLVGSPFVTTYAAWLPDATRFAYVTGEVGQVARAVRIKNIATGDDRELYRDDRIIGCVAPHQVEILYCAKNVDAGTQVVSVSLDSGRTEARGTLHRQEIVVHMTTDDRKIVFYNGGTNSLVEWQVETGEERPISYRPSPDGRWQMIESADATTSNALRIRPTADGSDWRVLVSRRVPPPGYAAPPIRFSPDGNWVLYHDRDAAGKDGLYRVAAAGGEPQRLGDYPVSVPTSALSISRDGRRFIVHAPIAGEMRRTLRDYWVLENFLPK